MFVIFLLTFFLVQINAETGAVVNNQPEQIHLAFGEKLNDIVVTWSTLDKVDETLVKYGDHGLHYTAKGQRKVFTDQKRNQTIHLVTLKDLKFNTLYFYKVGSARFGWSSVYWFKTVPEGDDWTVRASVFGDLGNRNARSLPYLQDEALDDIYDFTLHIGDFAYNVEDHEGKRLDAFMKQVEPIAAYMPYMTCPGNHEKYANYSHYKSRFMMPGNRDAMYYSWDAGRAHFISISTEHYYDIKDYGTSMVKNQYEWLLNDLKNATTKENREKRPWIIIYGHRPMYCTNNNLNEWEHCQNELTRTGLDLDGDGTKKYGLEELLIKYGVDLAIWAHEHSYERLWPLYKYKVYNGSFEQPYVNPRAPVHIISGSAGCVEKTDSFKEGVEWSAFQSSDYGYGRFQIYNKSHLYFEQTSVGAEFRDAAKVIDSMWLVKDTHGPYHF